LYISIVIRDKDNKNPNMKKLKVQIAGETYEVSEKALRNYTTYENKIGNYLYISHTEAGSLVRQFAKKFFPQYLVRVSSSSFSGGNALDVYVSTQTGGSIPQAAFQKIREFANLWEYGKFDGMTDCYEYYDNSGLATDKGTELKAGVKYVHVNNRPKFGTVEAILNEVLNEGRKFEEVIRFYTDSTGRPAAVKAKLVLDKLTK
jgi:hypothetical protein